MTSLGIGVIIGFISLAVFFLERTTNHDPIWILGFLLIFFGAIFTCAIPVKEVYMVRVPLKVEKTSEELHVKDDWRGWLHCNVTDLFQASTNDIVVWERQKYNLYGYNVRLEYGTGLRSNSEIRRALSNENHQVEQ